MITRKDAARLKKQIEGGARPKLMPHLWWVFNSAKYHARQHPGDPNFRALVEAGIVTAYGHLTDVGRYYERTVNGQYNRNVQCDC